MMEEITLQSLDESIRRLNQNTYDMSNVLNNVSRLVMSLGKHHGLVYDYKTNTWRTDDELQQ